MCHLIPSHLIIWDHSSRTALGWSFLESAYCALAIFTIDSVIISAFGQCFTLCEIIRGVHWILWLRFNDSAQVQVLYTIFQGPWTCRMPQSEILPKVRVCCAKLPHVWECVLGLFSRSSLFGRFTPVSAPHLSLNPILCEPVGKSEHRAKPICMLSLFCP